MKTASWCPGLALLLSGCSVVENSLAERPQASLRGESSNCRTITLPGGWLVPNDPAHAAGYFAEEPNARLVYRLDLSTNDLLIGLILPAAGGQAEEECPRHFAVSLKAGDPVEADSARWKRARPIVTGGPRVIDSHPFELLLSRASASAKDAIPHLSPDGRFVVLSSLEVERPYGDGFRANLLLDVHDVASGKQVASLRGRVVHANPEPRLTGGTWISDRHLIVPAQTNHAQLILCDLSAESPTGNPVIVTLPDQPVLLAVDTGTEESWASRGPFPFLHTLALLPEELWSLQWRATNPQGRSAVHLIEAGPPGGFAWFRSPIPGNELRDGPYKIDAFTFLDPHSERRVIPAPTSFLTPNYQYPRDDAATIQADMEHAARWRQRPSSNVPKKQPLQGVEVQFAGSVKEGAATVYTIDCLTQERPAPMVGFGTSWDLPGANAIAKPDVGLCQKGATKVYFTPPPNPVPPGNYQIMVEARAGNFGWSTSESWVVEDPSDMGKKGPQHMVPITAPAEPLPPEAPLPLTVVPYWGQGTKQRFTFVISNVRRTSEIASIEATFAFTSTSDNRCSFEFDRNGRQVTLKSGSSEAAAAAENAFCRVEAPDIQAEGDALKASALVTFKTAFRGPQGIFVRAKDEKGRASAFELLGAWQVQ